MDSEITNIPLFSIIAPAYRNKMYEHVYESFAKNNNTSFEIIFVGDRPPQRKMPSNFKYIFTTVKCSQCVEIALRSSSGRFIIITGDDYLASDRFLDIIKTHLESIDIHKSCIISSWKWRGKIRLNGCLSLDNRATDFILPVGAGCFLKDSLISIGGIDRRFIGILGYADLYFRLLKTGVECHFLKDCFVTEIDPIYDTEFSANIKPGSRYTKSYMGIVDNELLKRLWIYDEMSSYNRTSPVEPFVDDNILEIIQGASLSSQR